MEPQILPDGWRSFLRASAFDLVCEVDREARYCDLSDNFEAVLGISRAELLGRSPMDLGLIHPEDLPGLEAGLRPLFEESLPIRMEYRCRVADGSWRWVESTAQAFRTERGEWRACFISRDITERKQLEASLLASEAKFRSLVEHGVDAILIGNPKGQIIEANRRAVLLTGYSLAELLELNIGRLFTAAEQARVPLRYDLLDRGEDVRSLRRLLRKDGTEVPVEMNTRKLPDGRYQAILRDDTERMAHQEALRASEERYRLIFDRASLGILHFDEEGIIRLCNDAFVAMMGSSRERLVGLDMLHQLDNPAVIDAIRAALAGKQGLFEGEYRSVTAGRQSYLRLHTYALRAGEGRFLGGIGIVEDLIAQHAAEQALAAREQLLEMFFAQSLNGFYIMQFDEPQRLGPDTDLEVLLDYATAHQRMTVANRAMLEQYGMSEAEFLGRTYGSFYVHDPETGRGFLRELLLTGRAHLESFERKADGTPVWIEGDYLLMRDAEGRVTGHFGSQRDITARKVAEEGLRASQQRLAELIEYLPDATLAVDRERRVVIWNKALEQMTGVPAAEMLGKGDHAYTIPFYGRPRPQLMDLLWGDDPETASKYKNLRHEGETLFAEAFSPALHGGQGGEIWLKAAPLRDAEGNLAGAIETIRDISDFRRAERALRESEDRFRGLYENTMDSIFWIAVEADGGFRYEGANPAHTVLVGITGAEILGRRPHECLDPALAAQVEANYRRCLEAGQPIVYEQVFEPRGVQKVVETLLVPIRDPSGRIYRLVGTSRDITQAKTAEEALRQAQKLESLGVLAGGIAHDFNNLLTAILGNLNLAQLTVSPESPAQPHLESVEKIVLKASELTRQMLAYSGKGRFVVRRHDLNEVVQEMAHLLHVSISKKIHLRLHLAPEALPVEADVAQIQQVIMNLVTNASDAIGDQEGIITLATRVDTFDAGSLSRHFPGQLLSPGRFVALEVSDTGCGIPRDLLDRIFDPFFTTKTTGRGLGLSAMLGILRGHGAGYAIDSEPGRGTRFGIFFPAATAVDAPSSAAPEATQDRLSGTLLLVDDEPTILAAIGPALERFGLRVLTARDGQEALEVFSREPGIGLVLMDLTMPRMDGREAFRALRRLDPGLRVILSSGYSEQESVQAFLGEGLAGFIQKPYQLKELRELLLRCFHSS